MRPARAAFSARRKFHRRDAEGAEFYKWNAKTTLVSFVPYGENASAGEERMRPLKIVP